MRVPFEHHFTTVGDATLTQPSPLYLFSANGAIHASPGQRPREKCSPQNKR